jgi:hypothetical protein
MKTRLRWSLGFAIVLAALVGWLVNGALAAGDDSKLTLRLQPTEHAFVTQSGTTSTFPGYLGPGARALSRDALLSGSTVVGYDNELCTAVLDSNDYCEVTLVLSGKGQIQASWLWIGRNGSLYGPPSFSGVIVGGTGAYASAHGQFDANVLPNGQLQLSATLR